MVCVDGNVTSNASKRGLSMKKYVLAAVAVAAISAPATARDRSFYVGLEGGTLSGRSNDIDDFVEYTTVQSPATPLAPAGPVDVEFDDVFRNHYKKGYDIDAVAGYDFGFFRLVAELGRKRASIKNIVPDDIGDSFFASLNTVLNRPSEAPDPGAPGLPALTAGDFDLDGNVTTMSAMINGLVDIGIAHGFSVYGGAGYGRSRIKAFGEKESAWAWQKIFGARYAISPSIDLGVKYRYFASGAVALKDKGQTFGGNPNRLSITPPGGSATLVDQTTNVLLVPEFEGRFRSRSLLASLIFKIGRSKRPPPPEPGGR